MISLFVRWDTEPTIGAFGGPKSEAPPCIGDSGITFTHGLAVDTKDA